MREPFHKSSTYRRCRCGEHCADGAGTTTAQPCWGKVAVWFRGRHTCQGHIDLMMYEPEKIPAREAKTGS